MCMPQGAIANLSRYNWEGDFIVHRCVVPASRPVVGTIGKRYAIDVREFLVTSRNEVMRKTLDEDIPNHIERKMPGVSLARFRSRDPGDFDLRAAVVESFVANRVPYSPIRGSGNDPWQFPDETLSVLRGDCEDRALLIASLLISSGISSYNVRVALGVIELKHSNGQRTRRDHAWVMYKNEAGRWTVVEPLAQHGRALVGRPPRNAKRRIDARAILSAEYIPSYVFNDDHLWGIERPGRRRQLSQLALRRTWTRIHPRFLGEIHQTVVHQALESVAPQWVVEALGRESMSIFGQTIDGPDNFLSNGYDSLDHFDNGFIDDGWTRVDQRLMRFKEDNHAHIGEFVWAAHAIADFYSHSSYAHFARNEGGYPMVYTGAACLRASPNYENADFDLAASGDFTTHKNWRGGGARAARVWAGQLLSGRYAQRGDSKSALESLTPTPDNLLADGDYRGLPHHDEIAVDSFEKKSSHVLYVDPEEYKNQYVLRELAAIRHVRKAFEDNWTAP